MNNRQRLIAAIFMGGFIAGTVDIGAAALIYWVNPIVVLHSIASGVLGKVSFQGGAVSAVLGLVLQWGMSFIIAAVFVFAAGRFSYLVTRWVSYGVSYGVIVFIIMNYLVVPLSAARSHFQLPHFSAAKLAENLLAMIIFGLIVAYFTRVYFDTEDGFPS